MPPNARQNKKLALNEFLRETGVNSITAAEWSVIRDRLAPISESYLRRLLRATGLPVAQPFAGVDQTDFDSLEQSLLAMLDVYRAADPALQRRCRGVVIEAKTHARLAARRFEPKRAVKEEMAHWMLVWLETPDVFPIWVKRRRQVLQ